MTLLIPVFISRVNTLKTQSINLSSTTCFGHYYVEITVTFISPPMLLQFIHINGRIYLSAYVIVISTL